MGLDRIKVLCVDDSVRLTDAWSRFFRLQPDVEMVGSLTSADAMIQTVADRRPDIVLVDLNMAGRDPLDAVAELTQNNPDVRVIVCTGHADPAISARAVDAGAWGCISKAQDPLQILGAIRRVAAGQVLYSDEP